eukprot:4537820-Amphidinium_carterae.3
MVLNYILLLCEVVVHDVSNCEVGVLDSHAHSATCCGWRCCRRLLEEAMRRIENSLARYTCLVVRHTRARAKLPKLPALVMLGHLMIVHALSWEQGAPNSHARLIAPAMHGLSCVDIASLSRLWSSRVVARPCGARN